MYLGDGKKYVGEFKDNKKSGRGVCYYKDGGKYIGDFLNDLQHGQGLEILADGQRYEGTFSRGNRHGWIKYTIPDRCTLRLKYHNGNCLSKIKILNGEEMEKFYNDELKYHLNRKR